MEKTPAPQTETTPRWFTAAALTGWLFLIAGAPILVEQAYQAVESWLPR